MRTPSAATPINGKEKRNGTFPVLKAQKKEKDREKDKEKDKKVTKHVPKAQTAGMSVNDLRACRNAVAKLQGNKHAQPFLQPVDPVRDRAPK